MGILVILTILTLMWIVSCANPRMAPSADWEAVRRWAEEEARERLQQYVAEHEARVELYGGTFFSDGYRQYKEGLKREAARRRWEGLFRDRDVVVEEDSRRQEVLALMLPPITAIMAANKGN